ncbi:hypothetical protein SALB1_0248 [Salinisphaera sp. LB1]|nr:hypothetical protein SALB1_0248 [Salinisphaera sp. LB1]
MQGLLALCLFCNALGWSFHVQAASFTGADHSIVQADGETVDSATHAADAAGDDLTDHCGHGELHFLGIIPSLNAAVASVRGILNRAPRPHYAGPRPEPLITPPIA